MSLGRLTGSEIRKTLSRPSLYIMGIFLVVLLVFTAFIYNPNALSGSSSQSYNALKLYGNTANEVINNFESNKNKYTVSKVGNIDSVISFYTSYETDEKLNYSKVYSKDNSQTTLMSSLFSAYTSYISIDSDDPAIYRSAKLNLEQAYTSFKAGFEPIINSQYPVVRIYNKTKDRISSILSVLDTHIIEQEINSDRVDGYKSLADTLIRLNNIPELQSNLDSIERIIIGGEFLQKLSELSANINVRTNDVLAVIPESETADIARKNCAKYVSVKITGERLIGNKLYLELIGKKSDSKVNSLFKLNTNPFINDKQETFFRTYIEEQIAIDNYLFIHNKYDFEFNQNFSKYTLMADDATAFDYAFYAMEFMAFFIIMCACIIGASSIAGEYTSGTMRMLAIRPYKRSKIISSKFLSTLILTFLLLLLTGVIVIITGIINYGISLAPILTVFNSTSVFTISPIVMFIIYFLCVLIKAIVFISISIMFSVIFKNVTPAIIVTLIAYFVAPIFTSFVPLVTALTYLPLINIDLFKYMGNQHIATSASQNSFMQIFTSQNFLSGSFYITLILVCASIALCLSVTYVLFRRRDV